MVLEMNEIESLESVAPVADSEQVPILERKGEWCKSENKYRYS